ncbi:MAG: terminase small subunit [Dehalococcoidia bacterium]
MTDNLQYDLERMPTYIPVAEEPDDVLMEQARVLAEQLTPRQRALVKHLFEGKNQAESARLAGYPPASARQVASRELRRPEIRELIRTMYEANGMDVDSLAKKNLELLDARQYGLSREGLSVELGPDAHAQVKALDLAFKVGDYYPNPRLDVDHSVSGKVIVLRSHDVIAGDPFSEVPIEGEVRVLTDSPGDEGVTAD